MQFFFQIPTFIFSEIDSLFIKFLWKCQGFRIDKIILRKNKVGGHTLPDFEMYFKVTVIKAVGLAQGQISGIESPEINPGFYGQLIFDNGLKTIQCRKRSSFF